MVSDRLKRNYDKVANQIAKERGFKDYKDMASKTVCNGPCDFPFYPCSACKEYLDVYKMAKAKVHGYL